MQLDRLRVGQRLDVGFGLVLAILIAVTLLAVAKVHAIERALVENTEEHAKIQRYAINFRGSAHDRSIAIRDVVLATDAAARQKEMTTIAKLADFHAASAGPLETLLAKPDAAAELAPLYKAIQDIETRTVATTQKIQSLVEAGDKATAEQLLWREAKPQYEQWLAAINRLIDFEARVT